MRTKICTKCKKEKSCREFYGRNSTGDKKYPHCKDCCADARYHQSVSLRREAYKQYGGAQCNNCGETFYEVLVIDHIYNNGCEERKQDKDFVSFLRRLKQQGWPPGYQVLCHNCNFLKSRYYNPSVFSIKPIEDGKKCSTCGRTCSINDFYLDSSKKDSHNSSCKDCHTRSTFEAYQRLRQEAYEKYGGARCNNCGRDSFDILCLDHISGGGRQETKRLRKSGKCYLYYLKQKGWPSGFQVLCHNCNALKHQHPELLQQYKEKYGPVV